MRQSCSPPAPAPAPAPGRCLRIRERERERERELTQEHRDRQAYHPAARAGPPTDSGRALLTDLALATGAPASASTITGAGGAGPPSPIASPAIKSAPSPA